MAWTHEADTLASKDLSSAALIEACPSELDLAQICESAPIFQVRYDSLAFAPGHSARHIEVLSKVLRSGELLDPVTVAAFGNEWYLLDGHHRLEAYRTVGWSQPVPVKAATSATRGRERVQWAADLSLAENRKDRLNISAADKQDAAWRKVLQDAGSISAISAACGVSTRQVSNMREVKSALLEAGLKLPRLMSMGWRRALFERSALNGEASGSSFDLEEQRRRHLAKRVKATLDLRPPASVLLEMLESMRPGISTELETAIQMAKEEKRHSNLEI